MNKSLASLMFRNETLFYTKEAILAEESFEEEPKTEDLESEPALLPIKEKLVIATIDFEDNIKDFLEKILASVNIKISEAKIINNFSQFEFKDVKEILIFGNIPGMEGIDIAGKKYEINISAGKRVLWADSLETISDNHNSEKRKLWNSLKEMYHI